MEGLLAGQDQATYLKVLELEETMSKLMFDIENSGWVAVGLGSNAELTESDVKDVAAQARLFFLANPLINRAVEVQGEYVWASGVTCQARDKQVELVREAFFSDPQNQRVLFGHVGSLEKEKDLMVTGNVFLVLFPNPSTGTVRVSCFPLSEYSSCIKDPENRDRPRYWKRAWTDGSGAYVERYYADWSYRPRSLRAEINGVPVDPTARVMHIRVGGFSDWTLGVSEVHSAIPWARAYTKWLEDWSSITRSLARFAWKYKGASKASEVAALKSRFGTTVSSVSGSGIETNPSPVAGSIAVLGEDRELEPIKMTGVAPKAEDGRMLRLMAVAALGWPDSFFGDMDQSSLATAKSLDRPTELKVVSRQQLWADVYRDLFSFAITESVLAPNGVLRGRLVRDDSDPSMISVTLSGGKSQVIDIMYPPVVVEHMRDQVASIVDAATLGGRDRAGTITDSTLSKLLLTALGLREVEAELEAIASVPRAQVPQEQTSDEDRVVSDVPEESVDERALFVSALRSLEEKLRGSVS